MCALVTPSPHIFSQYITMKSNRRTFLIKLSLIFLLHVLLFRFLYQPVFTSLIFRYKFYK